MQTREQAWALLNEWTKSESLLKHGLAVEAAMRWYARYYDEDVELWGITGLLHDFDYERYPNPTPEGHPYVGCEYLSKNGFGESIPKAIMGHAKYTGVARDTLMAKALFACDELAGLVTASVLVRPDRSIHNLEANSVKKKMKDKAFARGVDRDDIRVGCEELGIEIDTHIRNVIEALREQAKALGLGGTASAPPAELVAASS